MEEPAEYRIEGGGSPARSLNDMRVDARAAGMCPERLRRVAAHLDRAYVGPGKIAGALPLVFRKGALAYAETLGRMDLERDKPMALDTIFRIYSMTKPITSVALMMLYEEGAFQLGDRVSRFIPAWRDLRVYQSGVYPTFQTAPVEREMTVRDLLTHMSGLTYGFMSRTNVDHAYRRARIGEVDEGATLADMIERLAHLPLEFSPGTAWNYSVATDVCGHLIEVLSGQTLAEFFAQRIFAPLGMVDTGFTVPDDKVERFAANYVRGPDKRLLLEDDPQDSRYIRPRSFLSGGGGLVSTAADYLQFCRMLLGGGELEGRRLLGRKTLELMSANHLPNGDDLTRWAQGSFSETDNQGYGFGLGFSVNLGPGLTATSSSAGEIAWGGAASTIFWVDPQEDLAVIFLTQLMPSGTFNFRGQLKSLVYQAIVD
ncbi:MAG: serine hydrolase domain-containing protein [Pseudomonadota bacterium]